MEETQILVSIITVCFNSASTIQRTIKSVLNQTYQNYEYIIIDGNSTDKTIEIIKEYEPKFKGRLRFISEADKGIYYAMNKGISMASGEMIGIINSDDWYEPNAIADTVKCRSHNKYQVLYGFMKIVRDGITLDIEMHCPENLDEEMICHPTCFVSKSVYDDFGAFDLQYPVCADFDLMLRLYRSGQIEFIPVFSLVANFTRGGASDNNDKAILDDLRVRIKYGNKRELHYFEAVVKSEIKKMLRMFRGYR